MTTQLPSTDTTALSSQAAQVLRTLALDEKLKWRIPQDPVLGPLARKVARRFVAGESLTDALDRAKLILAAGHRVNVEYMGESCRDRQRATAETDVFVDAARLLPPAARSPSTSPTSASPSMKNSPWRTPPASRRPQPRPHGR